MTKKKKHQKESISKKLGHYLAKLSLILVAGIALFCGLVFVHPLVGLLAIPVISIIGYRYMTGGFKWPKVRNQSPAPTNPPKKGGNPSGKLGQTPGTKQPSQQNQNTNQVVKINFYGIEGRPSSVKGPNVAIKKPAPTIPPQTNAIKPEEVLKNWKTTMDAFIENNRHKFLNLMGSTIEQAIRYASLKEFGKIISTTEAISALGNKNYFHYPRNHLLWLWQCRNDYAHEARVMKTDVDQLSEGIMLQIFEVATDIVTCCLPQGLGLA